jgi:hypothetical protein
LEKRVGTRGEDMVKAEPFEHFPSTIHGHCGRRHAAMKRRPSPSSRLLARIA